MSEGSLIVPDWKGSIMLDCWRHLKQLHQVLNYFPAKHDHILSLE